MAEAKTVKVRVFVAINDEGHYSAVGYCCGSDAEVREKASGEFARPIVDGFWMTAEREVHPRVAEVAAEVSDGE